MATTSFIYHTQGLAGYRHLKTEYKGGKVIEHIEAYREKRRCPNCGARWYNLELCGRFKRSFLALPVGSKPMVVVFHGHRLYCRCCGQRHRERVSFAQGQHRYIKAFARYVVDLCRITPIKQVAELLGVSWDLVKEIHKAHLHWRLRRRRFSKVRRIAVDEFSIRRGHRYMTVVMDLDTGAILHAQEGKDATALKGFMQKLKRSRAKLEAVAMDMSEAYRKAVRETFGSQVAIVHDQFHVVALANEAIDQTRRKMVKTLEGEQRKVIKGTRYLLLSAQERLNTDQRARLDAMLELNQPLSEAYLLKEQLRQFWDQPDLAHGQTLLDDWIGKARACVSRAFHRLAQTLEDHKDGLLAYFQHRISTGPLEGMNNKIKVLKRQAYGFRDMEYFKLRLFYLHEATYRISG